MDTTQATREQIWAEAFFLALEGCLKQLGHRKAPPCVDDADEIARLAVAKFDAFRAEANS